ncbi:MAG: glutamyl-tRNA reductase [Bacteroidota bacterium]|nr:glutamyl-tRNA reductase [Bacteroidota bacterium]
MNKHETFYCIGLSYQKADAEIRGKFSLNQSAKENILNQAKAIGLEGLIIISTCNRTEIYGFAQHPYELIRLLCQNSQGTVDDFQAVGYVHKKQDAVKHIFKVGTGLDSQILGDFEIVGQIKAGFVLSKNMGLATAYTERLVNAVIQASRRVKNETGLSSGTTSVSFASVQYILNNVSEVSQKKILLFGTGKIGRNTCENLVKHSKNSHITLINRTKRKADEIAGKLNLVVKDYQNLEQELLQTDILVVATGAEHPTITSKNFNPQQPVLILDLSIPMNVESALAQHPNVHLVHLDELSKITDTTLESRKQYVTDAEQIIEEVRVDFDGWANARKFAPTINALKDKLNLFKEIELDFQRKKIDNFNHEHAEIISNRIIQKITTQFANHLKSEEAQLTDSISLIEKVFGLETSSK